MRKFFKRTLSVFLTIVMLLTAAPLSGFVGIDLSNFSNIFSTKVEAESSYFTKVWSSKVSTTNAQINANLSGLNISSSGFYIGTSTSNMKKIKENKGGYVEKIWYDMNKWYGKLTQNTKYYYKLYIIVSGKEYTTDVRNFTTTFFTDVWSSGITAKDAQINATFDLQKIDGAGFYIGTEKDSLKKISKSLSGQTDGAGNFEKIWYKMSKWYGELSPNMTYYYRLYIIKNGKECVTSIESFKTSKSNSFKNVTGKFLFATGSRWNDGANYQYSYNDGFFNYDSTVYQHDLALMSLALEASACVPDGAWENMSAGEIPQNAKKLLENIGFDIISSFGYNEKSSFDSIGCVFASKNIKANGTTVIAVAIRGGGYENEWGGNFRIGKNSVNHEGFDKAKEKVLDKLEDFIKKNKKEFNDVVKIWIVGYSRAAAVANLVAAELDEGSISNYSNIQKLKITKDKIYCYCFETPQNTTDVKASTEKYNNIHSIINPIDPVTKVAPSNKKFNFTRYGESYYLPCAEKFKNYNGKNGIKSKMSEVHKQIYGENYVENFKFYELKWNGDIKVNKNIGQLTYLNNLIGFLATDGLKSRKNYYEKFENVFMKLMATFLGGYKLKTTVDVKKFVDEFLKAITEYIKNFEFASFPPGAKLKKRLISVFGAFTEFSSNEVNDMLNLLDDMVVLIIRHPNYALTTSLVCSQMFDYHEGHVLVSWMAYLDTLSEKTRNQLLCKDLDYKTIKVNCPVDVSVFDKQGLMVASIKDDEVMPLEDISLSTYIDDNGQKCIVLPNDFEYEVVITPRENCSVSCSIIDTDGENLQPTKVVNYYSINVCIGEKILYQVEDMGEEGVLIDENENLIVPNEILEGENIKTFNIYVDSNVNDIVMPGGGEFIQGEYAQIKAYDYTGYVFDGWYINDELITTNSNFRFCVLEDRNILAKYRKIRVESVKLSNLEMNYKDSTAITPVINADAGVNYTVTYSSSDTDVAYVDENGEVYASGKGNATITCTVTDEYGNTVSDTCDVEVKYTFGQWLIIIILFGWIWYI